MRAARLIKMVLLLQTRGAMTGAELAAELEVSERTVSRDVLALSEAGVPVYADRGRTGGYRLIGGYRTRLTGIGRSEAEALFLSGVPSALRDMGLADAASAARLKVSAALLPELSDAHRSAAQRFHLDAPGWWQPPENPPAWLSALADAVWDDREVRMSYRRRGTEDAGPTGSAEPESGAASAAAEPRDRGTAPAATPAAGGTARAAEPRGGGTARAAEPRGGGTARAAEPRGGGTARAAEPRGGGTARAAEPRGGGTARAARPRGRELEPYGLVLKAGVWYLAARAAGGGDWRVYRVDRVSAVEETGRRFVRDEEFDLPAFWEERSRQFAESILRDEVVLRLSPAGTRMLRYATDRRAADEALAGAGGAVPGAYAGGGGRGGTAGAPTDAREPHGDEPRRAESGGQEAPHGQEQQRPGRGEEEPAEWVTVRLAVESVDVAYTQLLALGPECEVLEPPELRERFAEAARRMAAHYGPQRAADGSQR